MTLEIQHDRTNSWMRNDRAQRVVLLAPSSGLGGGIERYVYTIEDALCTRGIDVLRLDVATRNQPSTLSRKVSFIREARSAVHRSNSLTHVVVAHAQLLPVLPFIERQRSYRGCSVIIHGSEVWGRESPIWKYLARRTGVRVVAVSNFTAGVLLPTCAAHVLPPGLAANWFATLKGAEYVDSGRIEIVTVFRLESWKEKGTHTLLSAVRSIDDQRVHLTICGSGSIPEELRSLVRREPRCTVVANTGDDELARRLASAYVVVLATRTRTGRFPAGEGFGMVLLEAQVAGVPVIAPVFGGSGDAFLPGITGFSPCDESAEALAVQLRRLVENRALRDRMARAAADWARSSFEPQTYADRVVEVLLGAISPTRTN